MFKGAEKKHKNAKWKPKATPQMRRGNVREASTPGNSLQKMKWKQKNLNAPPVCVVLVQSAKVRCEKAQCCQLLTNAHNSDRVEWTLLHVQHNDYQWHTQIFPDERMFNLDERDGSFYYWKDLRKEKQVRIYRRMGGGLVTGCVAFLWYEKSEFAISCGCQTAETYCKTLAHYSASFILTHLQRNFFIELQQDNALIHHSFCTTYKGLVPLLLYMHYDLACTFLRLKSN